MYVARQHSIFHSSPGMAARNPLWRAAKDILMNIRLSGSPVATAPSVWNSTVTSGFRFWFSGHESMKVGYGKCFSASFSAVVTSDRVAFVLENVTVTWYGFPFGLWVNR